MHKVNSIRERAAQQFSFEYHTWAFQLFTDGTKYVLQHYTVP